MVPGRTGRSYSRSCIIVCVFKAPRTRGAGPLGVGEPTRLTVVGPGGSRIYVCSHEFGAVICCRGDDLGGRSASGTTGRRHKRGRGEITWRGWRRGSVGVWLKAPRTPGPRCVGLAACTGTPPPRRRLRLSYGWPQVGCARGRALSSPRRNSARGRALGNSVMLC